MNKDFLEWLEAQMRERNMSPADLSRASGLSQSHISRLFSEGRGAGIATFQALAKGLKLPPEVVYKAGGMSISSKAIQNARAERLAGLIDQLSEEDQEIIDSLIETLRKRGERKKHANGKRPNEAEALP